MKNDLVPQSESPKQPASDSDRVEKVWASLAEMFGERFVNSYGDEPPKIWRQMIEKMSNDHIRQSLAALGKSGKPHPPSLPEFYSAGKQASGRFLGRPETPEERASRIGGIKASPEARDRWLKKIRARFSHEGDSTKPDNQ